MNIRKSLNRLSVDQLEFLAFFMQMIKDWLVVICMAATIAAGCRMERTAAKYDAQLVELKQAVADINDGAAAAER